MCLESDCSTYDATSGFCTACSTLKINQDTGLCVSTCPGTMVDTGTQCTCNSTAYYNTELRDCFACTTIHASCTACSFDAVNHEGDCTACSSGSPSTDKRTCTGGGCGSISNC